MKQSILAAMIAAALGTAPIANATNWFALQNNQPPKAKPFKFWGFVQPEFVHNYGGAVTGLVKPPPLTSYNGQTPKFNLVAPDGNSRDQFRLFRARAGVRGVVPGTHRKINYFLLGEVGNNGLTRAKQAVFSDATVTFNYIPGARIRVGLGRLPLGEEAMDGVAALDYINFTNVTNNLLNEQFVTPYSTTRPTSPILGVPLAHAQTTGAVSGYRDVGVEVYDWFRHGPWEYAYAVMVSNGNGLHFSDNNGSKDISARLQASYIFGGKGPKRQDATVYLWHQQGKRTFDGTDYKRVREGTGFKYLRGPLRVSGEYMKGRGMIFVGPNPPFNDVGGTAFEPVTLVALSDSNKAKGYYLEAGWRFMKKYEADLRYDYLDRLSNSSYDQRKFTTWTLGAQYFYNRKMRFTVNYEIRKIKAPAPGTPGLNGTAGAWQTQLTNANTITNSIGNRISVQMTYIF